MAKDIFAKFDDQFDTEGLQDEIQESAENSFSGDFPEVPTGTYEVEVDQMELMESSKGDPMVKIWYRIVAGKYENQLIFQYQVITQGFQIHIVNEILRAMDTGLNIEFKTYSQYADLLLDVAEAIESEGLEFELKYGQNKKGFNTFEIKDVFQAED